MKNQNLRHLSFSMVNLIVFQLKLIWYMVQQIPSYPYKLGVDLNKELPFKYFNINTLLFALSDVPNEQHNHLSNIVMLSGFH